MVVLGLLLALVGWLAGISIVMWLGLILVIVGLIFNFGGFVRAPYGGGRYWY